MKTVWVLPILLLALLCGCDGVHAALVKMPVSTSIDTSINVHVDKVLSIDSGALQGTLPVTINAPFDGAIRGSVTFAPVTQVHDLMTVPDWNWPTLPPGLFQFNVNSPLLSVAATIPRGAVEVAVNIEPHSIASPETTASVSGGWWSTIALIAGILYMLTKTHRHLTDDPTVPRTGFFQILLHLFCCVTLAFTLTGCSGVAHTLATNKKLLEEAASAAGAGYGSYCMHRSGGSIPGAADKAKTDFQTLAGARKPTPAATIGGVK